MSEAVQGSALERLVAARERWLGETTALFASDDRVRSAWLTGSMGRGEGDAWADVDIVLVVEDEDSERVLATPADAEVFGELLFWVDCPHNAPPRGKQILTRYTVDDHLVMADLNVWPASFAQRPAGSVDLIAPCAASLPTTAASSREIISKVERPAGPRYSKTQRAEWLACMIHVASAFPPRGHDAGRMLALIEAQRTDDNSPQSQLQALRDRLLSLQPFLTPRAFNASVGRLDLAGAHLRP